MNLWSWRRGRHGSTFENQLRKPRSFLPSSLPPFLSFSWCWVSIPIPNIIFKKAFPASQLLEDDHQLVNYLQSLLEAIVPSGN